MKGTPRAPPPKPCRPQRPPWQPWLRGPPTAEGDTPAGNSGREVNRSRGQAAMGLRLRSFPSPGAPGSIPAAAGAPMADSERAVTNNSCSVAAGTEGFGSQNLVPANRAIAADGAALLRPAASGSTRPAPAPRPRRGRCCLWLRPGAVGSRWERFPSTGAHTPAPTTTTLRMPCWGPGRRFVPSPPAAPREHEGSVSKYQTSVIKGKPLPRRARPDRDENAEAAPGKIGAGEVRDRHGKRLFRPGGMAWP